MAGHPFIFGAGYGGSGGGGSPASLSVGLSSSSVDFGTSVTVTPTPTNLTAPITYTMSAKNSLGYYVDSVVVDGTFTYDCPFAGTFDIQVSAVDSLGNRAENVASITVGTIYAKHAITAAWEGKDAVLVSGQVDSIPDATGNANTATAPSSVTRLIKHSQITSEVAGVATNVTNSTRRLASTVSQLVSTITYFAVIDFNSDGLSGAFFVQAILGGSATPASNLGARYDFCILTSTNKFLFGLRNAAGSNAANITSTNSLANGKNFIVASYDGTTLTLTLNGVTQTNTYTGALWSPASCNIIVANTNVSSYTGGCSKPIWVAGVKTSNVADPAQLYADLVLKYTL
jgi:coenzyme F420-reducing hydrogenase delta subunit